MDASTKDQDGSQKKSALDDLSKEDLIKKCKSLLLIAKQAKQAKDEAAEEMKLLKEKLSTLQPKYEQAKMLHEDTEKGICDKEKHFLDQINTMQEMLSSLTNQKLQFTMEVDSLKKQNFGLENQMKELKMEEAKLQGAVMKLQGRIDELETANVSYERQNKRLSNENELLIQQMETLELEMRRKEEFSSENSDVQHKEQLEEELQLLRDELDCLKQEDGKKKEQMKELYENFTKEKNDLQNKLEEERRKKNEEVLNLNGSLKTLSSENERVLSDLKNMKENNLELKMLVESISAERDEFILRCEKLVEELKLASRQIQLLEEENKCAKETNICLESKIYELDELKRDQLHFDINSKLLDIFQQTVLVLQQHNIANTSTDKYNITDDNYFVQIVKLISAIDQNLGYVFSLISSNKSASSIEKTPEDNCNSLRSNFASDIISEAKDYFAKLYLEINLLSGVISDLEGKSEFLQSENSEMKKILDCMIRCKEAETYSLIKKCVPLLSKNNCCLNTCVCCNTVMKLRMEIDNYSESLELNTSFICPIEEKSVSVKNEHDSRDIEEELRTELNHCRQCLSQKNNELNLLQEELSFVLGHQREFGSTQMKHGICKGVKQTDSLLVENGALYEETSKLTEVKSNFELEIEKLQTEMKNVKEQLENSEAIIKNLEFNTQKLQEELLSKDNLLRLEKNNIKLHNNENILAEEQKTELIEMKAISDKHIEELMEKLKLSEQELKKCMFNEDHLKKILEEQRIKISELEKELTLKHLLLSKSNKELEILKAQIDENKEQCILVDELTNRLPDNSQYMKKEDSELELIKQKSTEYLAEKHELQVKSSESGGKEETDIECINKDTSNTLEDKVLNLESELQNLKFLYDEKSIELKSAQEEIESIKLNSVIVPKPNFIKMSELQVALNSKEKELENLRTTLLQTESNLAQTLIKLSEQENEYINVQHFSETLKERVSFLNSQAEERETEFSKLQCSFNEQCKELYKSTKDLQTAVSELEAIKEELERIKVDRTKAEEGLKNQLNEMSDGFKKCSEMTDLLRAEKEQLLHDLQTQESIHAKKLKELENIVDKLSNMELENSNLKEDFRLFRIQHDEVKKEAECLKNDLKLSNEKNESLEEKISSAKLSYDDTVKELEAILTEKGDELQEKLTELEEVKKSSDLFTSKSQHMKASLELLSSDLSHLKSHHTKLSEEVHNLLTEDLGSLQQEVWCDIQKSVVHCVGAEVALVKKENSELLGEMNEMNQVLKQRGETISKLKESNNKLEQKLNEINKNLEEAHKNKKSMISDLDSKNKIISELETTLSKLTQEHQQIIIAKNEVIESLEKDVSKFKECQHDLEIKTLALDAKEEMMHNFEIEIIKQNEKVQELESKNKIIIDLENELEKLRAVNGKTNEVEISCFNDSNRVKDLEEEVSALKIRVQQLEREAEDLRKENGDAPSEVMSCSTISRAEDSARLKDLEETFEERYTKLRTVAVRLKKKVSELTSQQSQWEADKKKLVADKTDLQSKLSQISSQAKNLQSLQQEYDRLQDELELQKAEGKQLSKSIETLASEMTALKVQLEECKEDRDFKARELELVSRDKQKLESVYKELSSQMQSMRKVKEAENVTSKEKEKEIKRLEDELKIVEMRLTEEVELHKNTQDQLEAAKQECKKRSVLSLEMEDYERSVAELTQQLAAEKSKVNEIRNLLETQREINKGLQEQISLLQQRVESEEERSKEVKDQLNAARSKLSELESVAQEYESSIAELTSQIEVHRDRNENLALQLSELAAEKQKVLETGRSQQDGLSRQVHILEEHVSRLKERLAERETELGDLKSEFGKYKVRAQSVLRQKARPEDGTSTFGREDFMEELTELRQTADILRSKLDDASGRLQTLTVENNTLHEDRTKTAQRCQELIDTVQDLRNQISQLQVQLQEMASDHHEALKSQKLQSEMLNQCYKKQIQELEEQLHKETNILKNKLQLAESQLQGTDLSSKQTLELNEINKHDWNSSTTGFIPLKPHDPENQLEISMLEREEGEGSESVDSTSSNLNTSQEHRPEPIPLDKLLSSPDDDITAPSASGVSPGIELRRTKEQLVTSECQIRHLTGLLSEAERDLAKLTQQNQVLKEEIRRQQRSVEREQHAQNFEYLKNIVLKFVTLQGGDERSRLVPVLNTILKLSPEETQQLNIVAKGGPDLQGGGRGWSSYLSMWSGPQ